MTLQNIRIPSLSRFQRDTRLMLLAYGVVSIGLFGIQFLIKILFILRLGYGLEYIGLFAATPALAFMSMSLPSGALGNRFGLKRMMVAGAAVSTVGMLLMPMTEFVPADARDLWPILCQFLSMAGWALFEINLVPALMGATTPDTRDDAYALMSVLRGMGTFVGTLVGGFLPLFFATMLGLSVDSPAPFRWSLYVGAAFGLFGLLMLTRIGDVEHGGEQKESVVHGPFPVRLIAITIVHTFLIYGGFAVCNSFCNAYLDQELHLSAAMIGVLTGIAQFVTMLAPLAMPVLVARWNNLRTMMYLAAGVAISLLPMAFLPHWFAVNAGRTGVIALIAIWMPTVQTFQMSNIERHWRSLAYATVAMGMSSSFGLTSLVGGFVAAAFGYPTLFLIGSGMSASSAGVMWALQNLPSMRGQLSRLPMSTTTASSTSAQKRA